MNRRGFLKLTGAGVAGACGASVASALAQGGRTEPDPKALTARKWGMVVDTRKCAKKAGCQACIDVCNAAHNIPSIPDPRHVVKWIWKEPYADIFPDQVDAYTDPALKERPVMTLCNHCDSPPCVRVCPTQATWKRADGLVIIDEHRCIGCRYCMAACPYGSRSFNWEDPRPFIAKPNPSYPTRTKGVVEKCTFCVERLAVGEPPACVAACQAAGVGALTFGDLEDPSSPVRELLRGNVVVRRKPELGTGPNVFYIV